MTITAELDGIGQLSGKHPLYLVFSSPVAGKSLCTITHLRFAARNK